MKDKDDMERPLSLASLGLGLFATAILAVAVGTDYWLYTEEPFEIVLDTDASAGYGQQDPPAPSTSPPKPVKPRAGGTGSSAAGAASSSAAAGDAAGAVQGGAVTVVCANSGLWRVCVHPKADLSSAEAAEEFETDDVNAAGEYTEPVGDDISSCSVISYFGQGFERIEGAETSASILRGIRRSMPAIMSSLILMIAAQVVGVFGYIRHDFRTVAGAVMSIIAALSLALGQIFYISAVNDEVAQWKRPENAKEGQVFAYSYGWAFYSAGTSFMLIMVAAVGHVTVYLRRYVTSDVRRMLIIVPGLDASAT